MAEFNGELMKASDVIKIIKACSESGVTEFKLGGLEFYLGAVDNEEVVGESLIDHMVSNSEQSTEESTEVSPEMEAELHSMQWEETLIADPLAHEELTQKVLDGEEIH